MQSIHFNTALAMLAAPDPLDLDVWKSDGSIMHLNNCVSLKPNHRTGTRTIKLLDSNQIRTIRDWCIFRVNQMEVYH